MPATADLNSSMSNSPANSTPCSGVSVWKSLRDSCDTSLGGAGLLKKVSKCSFTAYCGAYNIISTFPELMSVLKGAVSKISFNKIPFQSIPIYNIVLVPLLFQQIPVLLQPPKFFTNTLKLTIKCSVSKCNSSCLLLLEICTYKCKIDTYTK